MKTNLVRVAAWPTSALFALTLAGCVIETPDAAYAAPVRATVIVESDMYIPDYYVWDGYEYVGVVDGRYYYLGQGSLWFACEPWREHRFHDWERRNPRWHEHAERNDRFRKGHDGRFHPIGAHAPEHPDTPPPPHNTGPGGHDLRKQHPGSAEPPRPPRPVNAEPKPQRPPHPGNVAPKPERPQHPENVKPVARHQQPPTMVPPPHPANVPPPPPNMTRPGNLPPPPNATHPQRPNAAPGPRVQPPQKNAAKTAPAKVPAAHNGNSEPKPDNGDKPRNDDTSAPQKR
jgi:hypothetical protein